MHTMKIHVDEMVRGLFEDILAGSKGQAIRGEKRNPPSLTKRMMGSFYPLYEEVGDEPFKFQGKRFAIVLRTTPNAYAMRIMRARAAGLVNYSMINGHYRFNANAYPADWPERRQKALEKKLLHTQ